MDSKIDLSTAQIAEKMLSSGRPYTAASLAAELGISAGQASGKLFNIRISKKYTTIVSPLPNRTVKVTAISGRQQPLSSLMQLAIFGLRASGKSA